MAEYYEQHTLKIEWACDTLLPQSNCISSENTGSCATWNPLLVKTCL